MLSVYKKKNILAIKNHLVNERNQLETQGHTYIKIVHMFSILDGEAAN